MPSNLGIESAKSESGPQVTANQSRPSSVASKLDATRYVGSPALGTSKAAAAGGIPPVGPRDT